MINPYETILNDMGVFEEISIDDFMEISLLTANNCYGIAKQKSLDFNTPIEGSFLWKSISPVKYFKIYFTYIHSEDLLFAIDGFEELSQEEF